MEPPALLARAIILAGPSGAGKSHLARRLGLPVLNLDDFYRNLDDPALPMIELAGGAPTIDWDHPSSWDGERALVALRELCTTGTTQVPVYDIAASRRTGSRELELDGSAYVVAEGIFAHEIVGAGSELGLVAAALCVTQWPPKTFVRRLFRDLREHRKPPLLLLRRGLHLMRAQAVLVRRAEALGCRVVSPDEAYSLITASVSASA